MRTKTGTGNEATVNPGEGETIRLDGVSGGFGEPDIRQDGADAVIHYSGIITLQGVSANSLGTDDFLFV